MPQSRRDDLVETALRLFYTNGFHATGIDKVLAEAGVAKMTLYKHFRSKDELILAALRRRDEQFRNWFMAAVERAASDPSERLLAIFDVLEEWFRGKALGSLGFRGCAFIKAAAEYGDPKDPIHRAAAEHKRLLLDFIERIATEAGAADPRSLAAQLMLLKEGATVTAEMHGTPEAAGQAKAAAAVLIAQACRSGGEPPGGDRRPVMPRTSGTKRP